MSKTSTSRQTPRKRSAKSRTTAPEKAGEGSAISPLGNRRGTIPSPRGSEAAPAALGRHTHKTFFDGIFSKMPDKDEKLTIQTVALNELNAYENNSKDHPDEQVDEIAASIAAFGNCDPIAAWHDEDGRAVIVEGHGRLLALRRLGAETAPVIFLDHLSDEERRAYTHVHNQLTLSSGLIPEILEAEMEDMPGVPWEEFGFDLPVIDDGELEGDAEDAGPVEVPVTEPPTPVTKPGDIWQLGRHRIMCGDSTNSSDLDRLMDGDHADLHFGSPPYALVDYGDSVPNKALGGGDAYSAFKEVYGDEYQKLIDSALENAMAVCDDVMFVIGLTQGDKRQVAKMVSDHSDRLCDVIVWDKGSAMPLGLPSQRGLVSHPCEFIYCFNKTGNRSFTHPQWTVGAQTNVVRAPKNDQNEFHAIHHATFNVNLPYQMLRDFSETSVLDLFGGTGTTLIAAEQVGRRAYLMEIDPLYVDTAVQRWEQLTGEKAVRTDG